MKWVTFGSCSGLIMCPLVSNTLYTDIGVVCSGRLQSMLSVKVARRPPGSLGVVSVLLLASWQIAWLTLKHWKKNDQDKYKEGGGSIFTGMLMGRGGGHKSLDFVTPPSILNHAGFHYPPHPNQHVNSSIHIFEYIRHVLLFDIQQNPSIVDPPPNKGQSLNKQPSYNYANLLF